MITPLEAKALADKKRAEVLPIKAARIVVALGRLIKQACTEGYDFVVFQPTKSTEALTVGMVIDELRDQKWLVEMRGDRIVVSGW